MAETGAESGVAQDIDINMPSVARVYDYHSAARTTTRWTGRRWPRSR